MTAVIGLSKCSQTKKCMVFVLNKQEKIRNTHGLFLFKKRRHLTKTMIKQKLQER